MAGENGWSELSLREAGVRLIDCVHKTPPAAETGYPYVAIPQLKGGRVELDGVRRITSEHFAEWTQKALPQANDVILSRRCNPGETAWVNPGLQCALGQNLVLLRSDGTKVFPSFLRWLARGRDWWNQVGAFINVGAVFESLKCADIPHFRLPIPPLSEQKAIAEILGALDAKIELNRRMNLALESLARSLFKSWFVDFDPVRAKMDGREPPGLSPATAALFPDSFEHQNGALIPKGWAIRKVGDVTHRVTKGDTPRKSALQAAPEDERLIPMLRVNAITENGEILRDKFEYIPESIHLGKSKRSILQENDILYTNAGTIGRVSLVQRDLLPANTNQAIAIVRPDTSKVRPAFLFMLLRQPEFQAELHCDIVQAVQANLALGKIADAEAVLPPEDAIPELIAPVESCLNRIWANRRESETLAALRDTLLPRLLSGELRVGDVLETCTANV